MFETLFNTLSIILADVVLSGDNALVIGMAASRFEAKQRQKILFWGLALAVILRVVFAVAATLLLQIPGLLFFGGVLLIWVCVHFYHDIREHQAWQKETIAHPSPAKKASFASALITIALADFSMSIDNVIAVASIARGDIALLAFGLMLSILLMAFCATLLARLLRLYPWICWGGLGLLVYLAGRMLFEGWHDAFALINFV